LSPRLPHVWKILPGGRTATPLPDLRARPDGRKGHKAIPQRLSSPLLLLLQAHDYAKATGRECLDFAVEVADLRQLGMTNTDCRWLVCEGWTLLVRELKPVSGETRRFQHDVGLTIHRRACLVLTPAGEQVARQLTTRTSGRTRGEPRKAPPPETFSPVVPHWDRDRRELRLGARLIKQFKLPSPNQEMILTVFDEESWPARIDDPLPPSTSVNTKQRLHDTIKNLNRNQKQRLVRFLGDGTGQGVRWELITEDSKSAALQQ
jgi:hypothetical protein